MYNELVVGQQNVSDSTTTKARGNKFGAQVATELHGKYAELGLRGRTFTASSVIAGVALPVAAATLNSKFTIHNPAGSNKIIELISFTTGIDTATTVVNGIGMLIQRSLSTTSGIPTSTTPAAALPLGLFGVAKGAVYTQATLTNVAIPGVSAATAVPIAFYNMFSFGAVTAPGVFDCTHYFDGRVLLAPDDLAAFCTSVAAASQNVCGITWAEHEA